MVEVEVHDSKGNVVKRYTASPQEAKALPQLLEARAKFQSGDAVGAFKSLVSVCQQADMDVLKVIDDAKEKYAKDKEEEMKENERHISLLSEQGKDNILIAAAHDGSSVICRYCSAIVSIERINIHISHWCPALEHDDMDDE